MTISRTQSDFLDLSRWVAALLVAAEHARGLVFVDFAKLHVPDLKARIFYFMSGFGHEAVVVFFVISGYLVGGKVIASCRTQSFSWKRYVADRATRLYAVLFAALLIGAALDWLGCKFFDAYGLYDGTSAQRVVVLRQVPVTALSPSDFLINLLFLQTIAGPTFGSNAPLWSLANEWWYYMLLPLGITIWSTPRPWRSALSLVLAALLAWMLWGEILWLFGLWLLGVAASLRRRPILTWWLSAGLLVAALLLMRTEVVDSRYLGPYLVGGAYALLVVGFSSLDRPLPMGRMSKLLSGFSYSLYLVHFPVLLFAVSFAYTRAGFGIKEQLGGKAFLFYVCMLLLVVGFARIVALYTEDRTPQFRSWAYRHLGLKPSAKGAG